MHYSENRANHQFVPWRQYTEVDGQMSNFPKSTLLDGDSLRGNNGPDEELFRGVGDRLIDPLSNFFGYGLVPSPELNEVYELRLAKLEASRLSRNELVDRGAYFIGVDGKPTNHFSICTGGGVSLPMAAGSRLQSFIGTHRLKTSYATHGLFPYRGKFHPQMIKAILNIIGAKPGDVVLDPMAGSGTTAIEANIMGIDSVAVDLSPFCEYMMQAKIAGLSEDVGGLSDLSNNTEETKKLYQTLTEENGYLSLHEVPVCSQMSSACRSLIVLAFMDARGYALRSKRKSEFGLFREVLAKYAKTIDGFQQTWRELGQKLGESSILKADARQLPIDSESIDGVVFSPPYSFAVDYVQNDRPHLEYLGCDTAALRNDLVGLRGSGPRERASLYFDDMNTIIGEIARVLKKSGYGAIVVGSNSNQLAKALGIPQDSPKARYGIESRVISFAENHGLSLQLAIRRLIVGMANTMREEHIIFLRKVP